MSIKKTVEIEAIAKDAIQQIQALTQKVEDLEEQLKETNTATKSVAKGIGAIGTTLKAAGIGLAVAAFAKLGEVFNQNQKVTNLFNTTFEALSLAFNDFFNFLDSNIGTAQGFINSIFGSEIVKSITEVSYLIGIELITRVKNLVQGLGGLGTALYRVFKGDFEGASQAASDALTNLGDAVTGNVKETAEMDKVVKETTKAVVDYTKSIVRNAEATVDLNRKAEVGIAQNRIILEQKDREAEKLRQIRDDESKTIDERIEANNKLAAVLDEQERLMLANADAVIAAAQAQYDKNANDENQIALLEARAEREGILAQIEGFRSEQLMNENSLKREQKEIDDENFESKKEQEEELLRLKEEQKQAVLDQVDTIIEAAGRESAVGKALFIAKQGMLVKEQIAEAKATLAKITMKASESGVALAQGSAETAKVGFPQNIPLLIGFAAQAAGIYSSIKSAVGAAKSSTSKYGGSSGGASTFRAAAPSAPQAPAFNVVGASPENQLAQALGEQDKQPIKAFVVSNEVTNAQALDRNIVESASLG